jgi:hypothetical protein
VALLTDSPTNNGGKGDQTAPPVSISVSAPGAEQLTQATVRLHTPSAAQTTTQPLREISTDVVPPAPRVVELSQVISPELLASIGGGNSSNSSGIAGLEAKKAQSEATDQIAQGLVSKMQAVLNNPATQANPAAPATSSGGGSPAEGGSNQTSQNSSGQGSSQSTPPLTQGPTVSQSSNSSNVNEKTQDADSAAAVKAAGLTTVSVDPSLHALADAPGQSAWASAGSSALEASKENMPATSPQALNSAPQSAPLSTPLPAALSDIVQASQLYQRVGGAEMHLAMQTDLLGSIDLHAVVHQSTLSATIGVQRADVQSLLANDLPALQHALADQRFHVEQISVLDTSVGGHLEQGSHQQQPNASTAPYMPNPAAQEIGKSHGEEPAAAWSEAVILGEFGGQLSVRA